MDPTSVSIASVAVGAAGLLAAVQVLRLRVRQRRDARVLEEKVSKNLHIPRSLHPVIDTTICIGSLSCLKACPEGDILGIVDGTSRLVHADHCIGHGKCAAECPVDAIKLVMGTAERGVDLPEVDEFFESSRFGVHVVGELGGMGLIRNAIAQGLQVAQRLAKVLPRGSREATDVAIVGAGPAGLATAFGLRAAGRSFRLLEQGTLGGTIAHYPRQKVVMTEPVEIPLYGRVGKKVIKKEELLATWQKAIAKGDIAVEEGVKVEAIDGEDGKFVVRTSKGSVATRKVVLATGRRGTPRRLGVPGEELTKVAYSLTDPDQYDGTRVLLVGGGDSALEAAIQLAEESRAEVTLSYRGESLARAREANRKKVEVLQARGRIRLLLPSEVKSIAPKEVELVHAGRPLRIHNDFVLVLVGGELPLEFLQKAGVGMRRYFGEQLGAKKGELEPGVARPSAEGQEARKPWRPLLLYGLLGLSIIGFLAFKGWEYYPLSPVERLRSPLHKLLKPAGAWGHGVGIVATCFMLSNFMYAVRKRWRALKGWGQIRDWLNFHMFVGFMSPLVIAFHAAFRSNNLLATGTAVALCVVVLTGIIGRFIYGLVPSTEGRVEELEVLAGRFDRLRERAQPVLAEARDPVPLRALLSLAAGKAPRIPLPLLAVWLPMSSLRLRLRLRRVQRLVMDGERRARLRDSLLRLNRLRFQIGFYEGLRRLLRGWRLFHASLATFLVLVIAAHIGVSLYLGYGATLGLSFLR
ncbi:MAG TPA: NAD(P)-binding domain-containing protein [Anaeromyxobacteraceae bacterium]|nr:NAD(P)-binding domain-containing protein [Anaeromyxobacteraceae bacterium]